MAKRIRRIGEIRGGRPERHAQITVLLLQPLEITGDQRNEVIDVWLLLFPSNCLQSRLGIDLLGCLSSVGQNRHPLGHATGNGGGKELVGRIEAGEPVSGLNRFALSP